MGGGVGGGVHGLAAHVHVVRKPYAEFGFPIRLNQEKKQLEKKHHQALEDYKREKKVAKSHVASNALHLSLQQGGGGEGHLSSDRLFHSAPVPSGSKDGLQHQHTPTRPAKKSSLEKRSTVKTYAEATTSVTVEKDAADKKSRAEPANPERDSMQKKVVAELATGLVSSKPQQKRVPATGPTPAAAGTAGVTKDRIIRSGSVGTNVGLSGSTLGGIQPSQGASKVHQRLTTIDSEWTEFTGVTPKGSQVVGSSSAVTNGSGPKTGTTAVGGGGGGFSNSSIANSTSVDITEFDPIHKS